MRRLHLFSPHRLARTAMGHRLGGFIYGTIVALSVIVGGARAYPHEPGHIAVLVAVTCIVFWLAHVYADQVMGRTPPAAMAVWNELRIELKYHEGKPVIREISRVSKPGRRVYSKIKDLPKVYNGLGISILSTPKGVMSDNEARAANLGGEVLCRVF